MSSEYPQSSTPSYSFFTISKDLDPPGVLYESKTYPWKFHGADKIYETYWGATVRLRYYIKLSVLKLFTIASTKELDIAIENPINFITPSSRLKVEIGIENCLHIELEYDKSSYHLKDVILAKVYFVLVRIRIKYMEINIIKSEILKHDSNRNVSNKVLLRYEIMDGPAINAECIPVRLYLEGNSLTPTYTDILNQFSIKYYLSLILVDEEERRYFKKQEILLYRNKLENNTIDQK